MHFIYQFVELSKKFFLFSLEILELLESDFILPLKFLCDFTVLHDISLDSTKFSGALFKLDKLFSENGIPCLGGLERANNVSIFLFLFIFQSFLVGESLLESVELGSLRSDNIDVGGSDFIIEVLDFLVLLLVLVG